MKRIEFLDGLRGIAILLVICFHAFAREIKVSSYNETYHDFPLVKYGYLGVELFFLISGFVILMSLEKNDSFFSFIYKRWLRLFPAMLIATVLVYSTSFFLYERPAGVPQFNSILPGLIFMEPSWIKLITGIEISPLEGAFWSLYVEFKFYFIFGFLYFLFGKKYAIIGVFSLFILAIVGFKFDIGFLISLSKEFSLEYFDWFVIGSLMYLFFVDKKVKYLIFSILISLLEFYKCLAHGDLGKMFFLLLILILFLLPVCFDKTRFLISNKLFLFFGLISYPLYLIHENAMVSLIYKVDKILDVPFVLLPVIPLIILFFISYFIVTTLEPLLLKWIKKSNNSVYDFVENIKFW
jgi:peptidoglycan/LPS O-acetylase OafA/YrhL